MTSTLTRRRFSFGAAAGVVMAYDTLNRQWVSAAQASPEHVCVPGLDGELSFESGALAEAGSDFGHIIHHEPWVVLRPGSVKDISVMIEFANRYELTITMQGQSHSTYGQAQAAGGIVVDSRTLNQIYDITSDYVEVDAGVTWRDLVSATMQRGLAPLVLTDYLGLSVGGVLSVGGIGGATHRHGFVADNCLELEVVTGTGRKLRCSPGKRRRLFEAVLGGLGQYALITRAKIPLVPQLPNGRVYQLVYENIADYLAAQRQAADDERFDFLGGQVIASPSGGFRFMLEAGVWFDQTPPDTGLLLAGLGASASSASSADYSYLQWVTRVDFVAEQLKAAGLWDSPHPWFDVFMPDSQVEAYVATVLEGLVPDDVGAGLQLLYPFKRSRLGPSLVQVPNEEVSWLYDILRIPFDPSVAPQQVSDNRTLFDAASAVGAKRYPICAMPFDQNDWARHYAGSWRRVTANKRRFDPNRVLTPGQGMFRDRTS